MKLGRVTLNATAIAVIIGAAWLWAQCSYRDGLANGKQLEHDSATDRINAARATAEVMATAAWRHENDSLKHANAELAGQLARQRPRSEAAAKTILERAEPTIPTADAQTAVAELQKTIVLLEKTVAQDSVGMRRRDARIVTLEGSVLSYTDTIVPGLTRDRDKWKRQALRARTCGAGATVGYGVRGPDAVAGFTCRVTFRLPLLGGL